MFDPRVAKLAQVLVNDSLAVQPGWTFAIQTNPLAEDLALAVYEEALKAGAFPQLMVSFPQAEEIFYKNASEAQLEHISPLTKLMFETFDARLYISAEENTRGLSGIDSAKTAVRSKAFSPLFKVFMERAARQEMHWSLTEYPTHASAQEADMSLSEYQDFVFNAGKLNCADPVAEWKKEGARMARLTEWLKGRDQVVIKGKDV